MIFAAVIRQLLEIENEAEKQQQVLRKTKMAVRERKEMMKWRRTVKVKMRGH